MQVALRKRWARESCREVRRQLCELLMVMVLATLAQGADFPTPTLAEVNPAGIRGSLVICGGGQLPDAAVSEFLELAGGENARLAVVPTASQRVDRADLKSCGKIWRDRGFPTVDVVHTRNRAIANSEDFLAPIKSATAVWFAGGQQSLIAEA